MAEFGIHPYHQTESASVDLVLVHGLMGNSRDTWAGKDDNGLPTYWPGWIRTQRPDVNIWLADYDSSLSAWVQPAMPLDQIGGAFLMHAKDQGLGARPIHWVGHSMGGLIIKHLLRQAREKAGVDWHVLSDASRAITFLGTPHHGSDLAKWGDYFSFLLQAWDFLQTGGVVTVAAGTAKRALNFFGIGNRQSHVQQLRAHGKELGDLNGTFAQWLGAAAQNGSLLRVRNYFETRPVFKAVTVVPEHSARLPNALVEEAGVPADHFSICKFKSPKAVVFDGILKSFDQFVPAAVSFGSGARMVDATRKSGVSATSGTERATAAPTATAASGGSRDSTDLAWRNALKTCSADMKALACQHLENMLEDTPAKPENLEQAIEKAFEARVREVRAYVLVGNLRTVLRDATRRLPSQAESDKLIRLYWMLLVRAAALACGPIVCGANADGFCAPDEVNRLAITVAAHLVYGQGVELTFGPGGVEVENLIDLAATEDESAQDPAQGSSYSPGLRQDILAWVERVRGGTHTSGTNQKLEGALAGLAARPLLLDRHGELSSPAIRALARELGIGIVHVASDNRPASIAPEHWSDLCEALRIEFESLIGQPTTASEPSASAALPVAEAGTAQPLPAPPIQVNLHQTFAGSVGQSNVTTGAHSPIHAHHNDAASAPGAHDALTMAFVGFELTLDDHAQRQADLHALRDLVVRKDATPPAMSLLVRLLPPLLEAAQARPEAGEAWGRLRNAVHAHWPDVKPFI